MGHRRRRRRMKLTEWGADAVGCNCSAGPATVLSVIERMRPVTDEAVGRDAECRDSAGGGGPDDLSHLAGVHGQLYAQAGQGGREHRRRLLRDDSQLHAGDEEFAACAGSDGGRRSGDGARAAANKAAAKAASKVEPPAAGRAVEDWCDGRGGRVRHDGGDCAAQGDRLQQGDRRRGACCTGWESTRSTCRIRRAPAPA